MTLDNRWLFLGLMLLIVTARLVSMSVLPLMDTTEARYGEIARLMAETNNWITPFFDYGIPFWGKPPLHTWASATGIKLFGLNEFAIRIPHLLVSLTTLWIVSFLAKNRGLNVYVVSLVAISSLAFYLASGAVMTDALLCLSLTVSLTGFYLGWYGDKKWAYISFIGLGLGMLAKGPVIVVLHGLTILPWLLFNYSFFEGIRLFLKRIPVFWGLLIVFAIAGPWYMLAEQATPGFWEYFFVGEHWLRFFESGWKGDLYGTAHNEIRGMIWIFWVLSAFPWSFYIFYKLLLDKKKNSVGASENNKQWISFIVLWMISPMILFTFAGNILAMYVLPGLPALSLLVASRTNTGDNKTIIGLSLITPALFLFFFIFQVYNENYQKSDRLLIEYADKEIPLYYWQKPSFSGRFYSQGKVELLDQHSLKRIKHSSFNLVSDERNVQNLVVNFPIQCRFQIESKKNRLYLCTKI